jgi:replicative DNA helicase
MSRLQVIKNDPSLHRILPRNPEAEASLLSAIIINNNTLLDVAEIITPEDFYIPAHEKIFVAILDLFKRQEPIDLVTLANKLSEKGELEEIKGASYLATLVDTVPLAVNAPHYARIIHDKARLRRLIEKSNEIIRRGFEDQGDVDEVIDFAEQAIFEISESKNRQSFYPLGKLVEQSINTLEQIQGKGNLITGVPSGFRKLDELTAGLQPSDLIILAARPGMGKTSFALNIARNVALEANIPVAIFSLEMSKEQLSMRLLCSEARINLSRVRSGYFDKNDDWQSLTDAATILSSSPIYIDETSDISAMEIRAKARRLKMDKDIGLIIIDYIQLMRSRSTIERRELEIADISRSLKILAKELNVPIMALSQLNRKVEDRGDKRPLLSDLRESGSLEQDADIVMFIFREEIYNRAGRDEEGNPAPAQDVVGKAEIIIAKQRNGPVGTVNLTFLKRYTRFEDTQDYTVT